MSKGLKRKEEFLFFLLALPSLGGMMLFYIIPYVMSIYFSLIDNNVLRNHVGLKNYIEIFSSGAFTLALRNTIVFISVCVPANIIFPLIIALMLFKAGKYRNLFGAIFLLPLVVPSGSVVHFWRSIFTTNGIINKLFFYDNPVNWLETSFSGLIIIIIFLWKNAGYNMILFLAGLMFIPKEYYECYHVEGGGRIKAFFSITLVYLAPTTFLVMVMSVINSFKAFKEIYLLSGAYPHNSIYMLQHYMNNQFQSLNYQKLSAASTVVSLFVLLIVALLLLYNNRRHSGE